MAYYLGQHPEIFAPVLKEPTFFGLDLTRSKKGIDEDQYLEFYGKWRGQTYALDASIAYFVSQSAPDEIFDSCPNAKIIIMIRNPVDAIYSCYFQNRFNQSEPCETFEATLNEQEERENGTTAWHHGILELHLYYRVYSYKENIGRYLNTFGQQNVKLHLLDDLESNPYEVIKQTMSFLELEPVSDQSIPKKNTSKKSIFPQAHYLLRSPPGWMGYFTQWWLPRNTRIRIRHQLAQLTIVPDQNPPMRTETRQMLVERLTPEVEALSEMLGRDLTHWLRVDE